MGRWIPTIVSLLVAGNLVAAPPGGSLSQPSKSREEGAAPEVPPTGSSSTLEERNAELLQKHGEIWELMGLSPVARAELNEIVVSINTSIHRNENEQPEAFKEAMAVKRSDKPPTYESFVSDHKRRFGLLGISGPTQTALLSALHFTWKALHEPKAPEEGREAAEKIRDLMKSMGGPPPCCDDNIFERAGVAH